MQLVLPKLDKRLLNGPTVRKPEFSARIRRFARLMQPDSVAILVANPERTRSHDTEFKYRQNSDMFYLNGFPEPEAALILSNKGGKPKLTMLVRPKDRAREIWTGIRVGVDGARANYLADEADTIDKFEKVVADALKGAKQVYYRFGVNEHFDRSFHKVWQPTQKTLLNPEEILHEMRLFKTPDEVRLMKHAADISAEAHKQAMRSVRPGMLEYQLEAIVQFVFQYCGATSVAYNSIVATGNNAVVLHYVENNKAIEDGDLILIDAGCEYGGLNAGYAADITRCFPANGTFSKAQREIYQLVLDAQLAAIAAAQPGVPLSDVHDAASDVLRRGLKKMRLLPAGANAATDQKRREQVASGSNGNGKSNGSGDQLTLFDFFMHGTSHWLGIDVHDPSNYQTESGTRTDAGKGKRRILEPGMVITVEPGLYFDKNDKRVPARYRGIGVRIEDDVLITKTGNEVLTAAVPKEIDEIEELMAR